MRYTNLIDKSIKADLIDLSERSTHLLAAEVMVDVPMNFNKNDM